MSSLYLGSSQVLLEFLRAKSPLTTLIYATNEIPDKQKKSAYALTLGTLRFKAILDQVLDESNFMKLDGKMNRALILVMLYDLLLSPTHTIQGGGWIKKLIMAHANHIKTTFVRMKMRGGVQEDEELLPLEIRFLTKLPRYVRVNVLRTSLSHVHDVLNREGYQLQKRKFDHREVAWKEGEEKYYYLDALIPNLLVFSPGTDLHDHELLHQGLIILQDKASCMTAAVLDPHPSAETNETFHVLDACAAPGNKTTHLLAIAMEHCRKNVNQSSNTSTTKSTPAPAAATSTTTATPTHPTSTNSKKRSRASLEDDENDISTLTSSQTRATGQQVSFDFGPPSSTPKIKLEACEVDPTRYQLLQRMMMRALPTPYRTIGKAVASTPSVDSMHSPSVVSTRVTLHNRSFLDINPHDPAYSTVRAILLDPTCSGSGMLHRIEQFYKHRVEEVIPTHGTNKRNEGLFTRILPSGIEKKEVMENVAQLSSFQTTILSHALSFPNVQTVAYSTCSVHAAEDEFVLEQVLAAHPEFELATALPNWYRRGEVNDTNLSEKQAKMCVRSGGAIDGMNGFFVAKLVRKAGQQGKSTNKSTSSASTITHSKPSAIASSPTTLSVSGTRHGQPRSSDSDSDDDDDEEEEEEDENENDVNESKVTAAAATTQSVGRQTARNKKKREKAKKKRKLQAEAATNEQ